MNPGISYPLACRLASIAEQRAAVIGTPMTIALVDPQGGLLYFGRMDDALPASDKIAAAKAYSAAIFRMSTRQLGALAQPGEMLYGIENSMHEKIVLFGGGVPLFFEERVVGAVGISGGTVDEDIDVAQAVCDAFQEMLKWRRRLMILLPKQTESTTSGKDMAQAIERQLEQSTDPALNQLASIVAGGVLLADFPG